MGLMPESKHKPTRTQRSEFSFECGFLQTRASIKVNPVSDISLGELSSELALPENTGTIPKELPHSKALQTHPINSQLEALTLYAASIESNHPGVKVSEIFEANPILPGIIVTNQGQFRGMISRRCFFECMSRPYSQELFSKQPLIAVYPIAHDDILVLPSHTPIVTAVEQALQRPAELLYEPIVVQLRTGEYRLLDVQELLVAQMQIHHLTTEALKESQAQLRDKTTQLEDTLHELQLTQTQLIQTERMSSLGQLAAGVAHEIDNPINIIYGNLNHASQYTQDLLHLLHLYAQHYPQPAPEIQAAIEAVDLEFVQSDFPKLLSAMQGGANRICEMVRSLQTFSPLEDSQLKRMNIHEGLDSTLKLLHHRLRAQTKHAEIKVFKDYSTLPLVDCYPGALNQVFLNLFENAIDAIEEAISEGLLTADSPSIHIRTEALDAERVAIRIADNGAGMTEQVCRQLFHPFFTTKAVGQGVGLGLSISHQIIVDKHKGQLNGVSQPGQGSEFVIEIPIRQPHSAVALSRYCCSGDGITSGAITLPIAGEAA